MMLKNKKYLFLFFISLSLFSCHKEQLIPINIDISYTSKNNSFTLPASIIFTNNTTGAENYKWTFEGGDPATSTKKNPGAIIFNTAGSHTITLEAWSEDDKQTKEIIIQIGNTVQVDFDTAILMNNYSPVTVQLDQQNHWYRYF
jgi:hypothetical protein